MAASASHLLAGFFSFFPLIQVFSYVVVFFLPCSVSLTQAYGNDEWV